jgi:hypothetical protein
MLEDDQPDMRRWFNSKMLDDDSTRKCAMMINRLVFGDALHRTRDCPRFTRRMALYRR